MKRNYAKTMREEMTINILQNSDKNHESTGWLVEWNWFIGNMVARKYNARTLAAYFWVALLLSDCVCA